MELTEEELVNLVRTVGEKQPQEPLITTGLGSMGALRNQPVMAQGMTANTDVAAMIKQAVNEQLSPVISQLTQQATQMTTNQANQQAKQAMIDQVTAKYRQSQEATRVRQEDLEASLTESKAAAAEAQATAQKMDKELANTRQQLRQAQQDLTDCQHEVKTLKDDKEQQLFRITKLSDQLDDKKRALVKLQGEMDARENQDSDVKQAYDEVKQIARALALYVHNLLMVIDNNATSAISSSEFYTLPKELREYLQQAFNAKVSPADPERLVKPTLTEMNGQPGMNGADLVNKLAGVKQGLSSINADLTKADDAKDSDDANEEDQPQTATDNSFVEEKSAETQSATNTGVAVEKSSTAGEEDVEEDEDEDDDDYDDVDPDNM